uniref:Uncharacterized protein n=1 Tax=Arundo donax TaxID=35708 RepID=A0A0A9A9F6_ARUDO
MLSSPLHTMATPLLSHGHRMAALLPSAPRRPVPPRFHEAFALLASSSPSPAFLSNAATSLSSCRSSCHSPTRAQATAVQRLLEPSPPPELRAHQSSPTSFFLIAGKPSSTIPISIHRSKISVPDSLS